MASIPLFDNLQLQRNLPLDTRSVVADTAERDAIPAGSRYVGLETFQVDTGVYYSLVGGIENSNWVERTGGGGTETHPAVTLIQTGSGNAVDSITIDQASQAVTVNTTTITAGGGVPTEIDFLNQTEHKQFWEGTLAEYNAITTYDGDVQYYITDDGGVGVDDGSNSDDVTLAGDNVFIGRNTFTNALNVGEVGISHSERLTGFRGDTTLSNFTVSGNTITEVRTPTTVNDGEVNIGQASGTFVVLNVATFALTPTALTALSVGTVDVLGLTGFESATLRAGTIIFIFDTSANRQAFTDQGLSGDVIFTYNRLSERFPRVAVGDLLELHTGTASSLGSTLGEHYTITSFTEASGVVTSVTVDRAIVVGGNTGAAYFNPQVETLEIDSAVSVPNGVYLGGDSLGNFLDDYERGAWTPTITNFADENGVTTPTTSSGTYVKIGDVATLTGVFTFGINTDISAVTVTSLPFEPLDACYGSFASYRASPPAQPLT